MSYKAREKGRTNLSEKFQIFVVRDSFCLDKALFKGVRNLQIGYLEGIEYFRRHLASSQNFGIPFDTLPKVQFLLSRMGIQVITGLISRFFNSSAQLITFIATRNNCEINNEVRNSKIHY